MYYIIKFTFASLTLWIVALGIAFSAFNGRDVHPQSSTMQTMNVQRMPPSHIMGNNLRCVLLNMSGIAFAGIPTVLNLIYNGVVSGIVFRQISSTSLHYSELYYYGRHHVIEFIALWLSGGIGLCGITLFRTFLVSGKLPDAKVVRSLFIPASAVILITIVAAILESDISLAAYYKKIPAAPSIDSLVLISRDAWHAHLANRQNTLPQRHDSDITSVIIHHSGFPGTTSPLRLQEYQMNIRDMDDIAYHFYITTEGCVYAGRPIDAIGQHTSAPPGAVQPNYTSIGICLGGNFESDSLGPPLNQRIALHHLLAMLLGRYNIAPGNILFHRDFNARTGTTSDSLGITGTVCPGRFAISPLSHLIDTLEGL
jgi:uncharacterized membrane protein SpoIIM required for sporulation